MQKTSQIYTSFNKTALLSQIALPLSFYIFFLTFRCPTNNKEYWFIGLVVDDPDC